MRISENRAIVKAENLVKTFEEGRVRALDGVNLEIQEGQFVSIMGPSGSGKSTLLNMIGALDRPTEGRITVADVDLANFRDLDEFRAKTVGFVFQLHNLVPTLTALENIQIPMFEMDLSLGERVERAKKLLMVVGLEKRMGAVPSKLSGGERQRVAIARALANDPKIILADEPTGNLDTASSDEILHLLLDLNKGGQTIILVTHDPEMAGHANVVFHMKDGKILETTCK
ncbi:MAG: ABC transporter ATP-binding protein [Actinomycetota bacterium]|nr:ABC transporter ATP-binding protein [Actinomycetota bacterium]